MNNDRIDIELLEDYLDGKLDSKAMHQLEKQALEDPFIAQALAGLSESPKRASQSVSILQKQLYERIAQQQVTKKDTVFTWQRLSVAAAAAVMFISVSLIFFMREKANRNQQAKNQPRKVEVNMAPAPATIDSASKEVYASTAPAKTDNPITAAQGNSTINPNADLQSASAVKPEAYAMKRAMTAKTDSVATSVPAEAAAKTSAAAATASIATVAQAVSSPVDGWAKFDTYITDHNKLAATAKSGKLVELSFTIDSEGKPADIKVEKGISQEFDDEAVRLIKEGPKWEVTKQSGRVTYTIAF